VLGFGILLRLGYQYARKYRLLHAMTYFGSDTKVSEGLVAGMSKVKQLKA
jgi:hypothetical protein